MNATAHPEPAWIREAICWQVYPLGFCGAPLRRPEAGEAEVAHRLPRLLGWLDHLLGLGANVLLLNPVFDSVSHGYDTLDHHRIDPRLGDDEDFDALVAACHERGIRLVLDGVFNHVSARHPLVRQALAAGPDSTAGARIRWAGDAPYGFEGNADLVELNLAEPSVQDMVVEVMGHWLDRGADGWRLDAMYAAGAEAWAPILERVRAAHPEAWILGEVIHGDYPAFAAASGADSITQYELWKAVWSGLHDHNLFELAHALGRHQGFLESAGGGRPLVFVGNHDTTRIASQLPDGRDLAVALALLALQPGIPAVYAGDEFGAHAVKEERAGGDDAIRPWFPTDPTEVAAAAESAAAAAEPDAPAADDGSPLPLSLLKAEAAPRILEAHRRLLGLRRREPWIADAAVTVREETLENTWAEIVLTPPGDEATPLTLVLNLGEEDRPAPGDVLEQVSGADMLDGVGPAQEGTVPAHGIAVVR
jgi:glycosidase